MAFATLNPNRHYLTRLNAKSFFSLKYINLFTIFVHGTEKRKTSLVHLHELARNFIVNVLVVWHKSRNLSLESLHAFVDSSELSTLGGHEVVEPLDDCLVEPVDEDTRWPRNRTCQVESRSHVDSLDDLPSNGF